MVETDLARDDRRAEVGKDWHDFEERHSHGLSLYLADSFDLMWAMAQAMDGTVGFLKHKLLAFTAGVLKLRVCGGSCGVGRRLILGTCGTLCGVPQPESTTLEMA